MIKEDWFLCIMSSRGGGGLFLLEESTIIGVCNVPWEIMQIRFMGGFSLERS